MSLVTSGPGDSELHHHCSKNHTTNINICMSLRLENSFFRIFKSYEANKLEELVTDAKKAAR